MFAAYFGGSHAEPSSNDNWPKRLLMFACLITGVVVWNGYQASLTSKLAVQSVNLPFDSLETLLETSYK